MLSSYKVIKNNSVIENGTKEISTEYTEENKKEIAEKNAKDFIDSYEVLARTMMENARRQSDELIARVYKEAQTIEEEAYKKGYEEGQKSGYTLGTAKADEYYKKIKERAENEAELLNKNAETLLFGAKEEYLKYLEEKQKEIKALILSITESILKREIKDKNAISSMVIDALELALKAKTIIIKCNGKYIEDVKEKTNEWKNQGTFRGEIFTAIDDNLEEGTAEIIKENGRIIVSITEAMKKVREIIENSQ